MDILSLARQHPMNVYHSPTVRFKRVKYHCRQLFACPEITAVLLLDNESQEACRPDHFLISEFIVGFVVLNRFGCSLTEVSVLEWS